MITRDVNQHLVVPAFVHNARFTRGCQSGGPIAAGTSACAGGTCTMGDFWFPGFTVDRLGLREAYRSLLIAPNAYGDAMVTDENARVQYQAVSIGLQHTCTTGGTWANYSTGNWMIASGLWRQTTATSTVAGFYAPVQRDAADVLGQVMATATSTALTAGGDPTTSTGVTYYVGPGAAFDLGGAKRYIRCLIKPIFESTSCLDGALTLSAVHIFGEPDLARPSETEVKRILVTTPCAT